MPNKLFARIRIILMLAIIVALGWILIIQPRMKFGEEETRMIDAAKRYYDLNTRELPSGERIKTISLTKLYDSGILKGDIYRPFSKKTCSYNDSWVKVRKENGEYKYYVYLDCGSIQSNIDHTGPEITLNGKKVMNVSLGDEFKDPGIKSIVDAVDGNLKIKDATIKGKVDTSKLGTYEIQYIAFDKFNNRTVETRTVNVIKTLYGTIKKDLKEETIYKGVSPKNYVLFSNMLFRVYGIDSNNNIILVSDIDIANVNYTKLDKWLDYYYSNLTDKAKKLIVKAKYCNMKIDDSKLNTKECTSYTKKKNVYIPSIVEIAKSNATGEGTFMKPSTMSWIANEKNDKEAYLTRNVFFYEEYGKNALAYNKIENYGVRPMLTVKGTSLIKAGNGREFDPYVLEDNTKAKGGSELNKRQVGEYVTDNNTLWRIVSIEEDGATKVISDRVLGQYSSQLTCFPDPKNEIITYNPKDKASVAYFINNKATEYVDTSHFTLHNIKVPIYKKNIVYGEEIETKEYKVLLSAPNMYEMFSASSGKNGSYWLTNTTKTKGITGVITEIGVPTSDPVRPYTDSKVRVVGFYDKSTIISSGDGTYDSPYMIK